MKKLFLYLDFAAFSSFLVWFPHVYLVRLMQKYKKVKNLRSSEFRGLTGVGKTVFQEMIEDDWNNDERKKHGHGSREIGHVSHSSRNCWYASYQYSSKWLKELTNRVGAGTGTGMWLCKKSIRVYQCYR